MQSLKKSNSLFDNFTLIREYEHKISVLEKRINELELTENFIRISSRGKKILIFPAEIVFLQAMSNYTKIKLIDSTEHIISKTLKAFLAELPQNGFIRIHRSYVVNKFQIKSIQATGQCLLQLRTGTTLKISQRKMEEISRTMC